MVQYTTINNPRPNIGVIVHHRQLPQSEAG
jgi:hypothetical protein